MKNSYLYSVLSLFCLLLQVGCSKESQDTCLPCGKFRTVDIRYAETLPASGLETPLYIFSRPTGTQDAYILSRSYASVADGQTLRMSLSDLRTFDYRFLMIAQPADAPWLVLHTASGAPFVSGGAWDDLRLESAAGDAMLDGYCGFTDMSGDALLSEGRIPLSLTRLAGQLLFDFYRTDGSLEQPVSVVSDDVESVADRISRIEIEYSNPTSSLRFAEDGTLVPAAYASQPLKQTIVPAATGFKVALPQEETGLLVYDALLRGSLRIEGACLLPSDSKLRVGLSFTYFDTTPACGNAHTGAHTEECYPVRQVMLSLPAADAGQGLPVAADCFTVNRAGLRCDRIIDIPVGGVVDTDFGWL